VRSLDEVSNTINYLTNDEDVKQDLWVHYLSGKPIESLDAQLIRIKAEYTEDQYLQNAIWHLIKNPPSEPLLVLMASNFSEYERSIICMLMLGLNSSDISHIKGISEVRIKQTLATIRYNSVWSVYGIKEEPIG
jgi:hypothetical protein